MFVRRLGALRAVSVVVALEAIGGTVFALSIVFVGCLWAFVITPMLVHDLVPGAERTLILQFNTGLALGRTVLADSQNPNLTIRASGHTGIGF
jgi:hypothetical protein